MFKEALLNLVSLNHLVQLITTKFSTMDRGIMPDAIIGLRCLFFIMAFIILGKLITEESEKKKERVSQKRVKKPLSEVIKHECREIGNKEVNLNIFSHGLHCIVNKMLLYMREGSGEYFIVLDTDNGYLVESTSNTFHAKNEFSFICHEDEAAKEGIPVSINLFNYTLYDRTLSTEIYHYDS